LNIVKIFFSFLLYKLGVLMDRTANFLYKQAHIYATVGNRLFDSPPTDRNLYVIVYKKDGTGFVSMGYDNVWNKEALKRKYMLSKGEVVFMESIMDFRKNGLGAIWKESP
jgi:hypothetical protein